jgi:hypothetical protein
MQGHWLQMFALYCAHTRIIATRTSSRPWMLTRRIKPREAHRRLENAANHIRRAAVDLGVTPEQLDRMMQKSFDRTRLSARQFHERYGEWEK